MHTLLENDWSLHTADDSFTRIPPSHESVTISSFQFGQNLKEVPYEWFLFIVFTCLKNLEVKGGKHEGGLKSLPFNLYLPLNVGRGGKWFIYNFKTVTVREGKITAWTRSK